MQTILCGQRSRRDAHHGVGMAALSRHGVDSYALGDLVVAWMCPRRGCASTQRRRA
jgi:hypothetical protein